MLFDPLHAAWPLYHTDFYFRMSDIERVNRDRSAVDGGHDAVLRDIKSVYPGMLSLEDWVAKKKTGQRKDDNKKDWNNLSLTSIFLRK